MDKVISKISRGVGQKRKKSILINLASSRSGGDLLPSDDSSDEDFSLPVPKRSRSKNKNKAKQVQKKKVKKKSYKASTSNVENENRSSQTSSDFCDSSPSPWDSSLPTEILLKIFQYAIGSNPQRLKLLIRLSRVNRFWRQVAADSSLWTSVDLSFGWIKSLEMALKFLGHDSRLSNLQHLCLAGSAEVTPKLLKVLLKEQKKLRSLDVSSCQNIKSEGLEIIADNLKGLLSLSASNLNSPSLSPSLTKIIDSSKDSLQEIIISGFRWPSIVLMNTILSVKNLDTLDISNITIPSTLNFFSLLRQIAPRLKVLRISLCSFSIKSNRDVQDPLPFANLIELAASGMQCPEFNLNILVAYAKKLRHLDVRVWKSTSICCLSDSSINLPELETLNLANSICTSRTDLNLSKFAQHLKSLDISKMAGISKEACSSMLRSICIPDSQLAELRCAEMPVTVDVLRETLTHCKRLQVLGIESCRYITRGYKRLYKNSKELDLLKKHLSCTR